MVSPVLEICRGHIIAHAPERDVEFPQVESAAEFDGHLLHPWIFVHGLPVEKDIE